MVRVLAEQDQSGLDRFAVLISYMYRVLETGLARGRLDTLRRQLAFKFQALDAVSEARLQAATPEMVDRYLQRVLVADSLAAVFED